MLSEYQLVNWKWSALSGTKQSSTQSNGHVQEPQFDICPKGTRKLVSKTQIN